MTARSHLILRYVAWSLPIALSIAIIWKASHRVDIPYMNYSAQIHQVGTALKIYADDHQGVLPNSLEDLTPTYLDSRYLNDVQYLATGAKLSDLPPTAIILRRQYRDANLISELRADMTADVHKP